MSTDLITRQEYKTYAGINVNPNADAEIDLLIPRISNLIKTYCKRTFVDYVSDAKTEYFNGGLDTLLLEETPVVEIVSFEYSADYGQTYTELTEFVDWVLDNDSIVSINPTGFPKVLRGYKVSYKAGFVTIPSDLQLAVFDLITYYRRNDSAIHSTKAPGTNSVQVEYITTTSLPAHIKRVLDLYRADFV